MDDWSLTQEMIILRSRLLKNLEIKIEARPDHIASMRLYVAFKYRISFATDLAVNFGCNRFRIMPEIVSKPLSIAIWSRHPFLGDSDRSSI